MTEISRASRWSSTLARLSTLTVMAFIMLVTPAAASNPFAADLSVPGETIDLLTDANVRIDGAAEGDTAGYSVSGAGDVNGDGRDDVIVGAQYADNNERFDSGSAYVIYSSAYSSASPATIDLERLGGEEGFRIDGAAEGDNAGNSVSDAGDVNGDGLDDVIVSAYGADNNIRINSGFVYVIYGSALSATIDLARLGSEEGFRINGAARHNSAGWSASGAGDVNGDGLNDVIVGAYKADNNNRSDSGSAYVVYGSASSATIDLRRLGNEEGFRIDGAASYDWAGRSVSGAGDVNGDGRDDVIVGAPYTDNNGSNYSGSGSAYVIYGGDSTETIDLNALGESGFRIDGAASFDYAGWSVSDAGDVNGDGLDDLIVGAHGADNDDGYDFGSAYVIYGSASPATIDLKRLRRREGFRIDGAAEGDYAGWSVSTAGDVNGDGRDDVTVGAYKADNNGREYSGSAYVIYGSASSATIDLNDLGSEMGIRIDGAASYDYAGWSVSDAGDVNGDGIHDVIVGAYGADNNDRDSSGSTYVIYSPEP